MTDAVTSPSRTATVLGALILLLTTLGLAALSANRLDQSVPSAVSDGSRSELRLPVVYERDRVQGRWLAQRVRDAGYDIVGDTGSALIADGEGVPGFYVSAVTIEELKKDDPQSDPFEYPMSGYVRVGEVAGTDVFSDSVRLSWDTSVHRLWVSATGSVLPSPRAIAPLVRATLEE